MTSNEQLISKMEFRVIRLERSNRRWSQIAVVLMGILGCMTLAAADKKESKLEVIDASAIRIWDEHGHVRAVLKCAKSGNTGLALIDEEGKVCVTLGVAKNGAPGLEMCSHNEKCKMRLEAPEDGNPLMQFVDGRGRVTSQLPRVAHKPTDESKPAAVQSNESRGVD